MTSMTASTSPSVSTGVPALVVMVRMSASETGQRRRLVGVDFEEVLGAWHRQHRFYPLLAAGVFQGPSGRAVLAVQIHEAANRRAVHVAHRREIHQDLLLSGGHQRGNGRR